MKNPEITIEEAKEQWGKYHFVMGHTLSKVLVGGIDRFSQDDWDEILDIRFFSEDEMMHVFRDDAEQGNLKAVVLGDNEDGAGHERSLKIDKSIPGCKEYSELKIKEYYSYDEEDGQLLIKYVRPMELK